MTDKSKLFLACLGVGMASYIGAAAAASDAVLFKIHDIVPVKNADGNVTLCEVGATFYNRTATEISNAALNLVWADEVVADAINQEERNAKEAQRTGRRNLPRYNTATYNSRNVNMDLRLPPLKPHQQVTLKSKVVTDRCFLLLNDMEVNVTKCGTASTGAKSSSKANCDNLFRFVGPKSPEYYSEFKEVSADEQAVREQGASDKQKQEINNLYRDTVAYANNIVDNMKKARQEISDKE